MFTASSRIRRDPSHLYDVYVEVASPGSSSDDAFILTKYPPDYNDEGVLKMITKFIFPCGEFNKMSEAVQHVSFANSVEGGKYFTFGYVALFRALPWTNFFFKLLDHFANVMNTKPSHEFESLLAKTFATEVPSPGDLFIVESSLGVNKFVHRCHDNSKLPTIQDNRNLLEYFSAVDQFDMMRIFANMLFERRIIFTGSKMHQVSSCVFAANLLIYPLHWQNLFFPMLPMMELLGASLPFIVGVSTSVLSQAIHKHIVDLKDVVVMNIDDKTYQSLDDGFGNPVDDLARLPQPMVETLRENLKTANNIGDGLARSFLRAMVVILQNYREALVAPDKETGKLSFDPVKLVNSVDDSIKPFIQSVFIDEKVQPFQQFMEERLEMISSNEAFDDEFEMERKVFEYKKKSTKPTDFIFNAVSGGITELQKRVYDFTKDNAMLPSASTSMKHIQSPLDALGRMRITGGGTHHKKHGSHLKVKKAKKGHKYTPSATYATSILEPNIEIGQVATEESEGYNFLADPDLRAAIDKPIESRLGDLQITENKRESLRSIKSTPDVMSYESQQSSSSNLTDSSAESSNLGRNSNFGGPSLHHQNSVSEGDLILFETSQENSSIDGLDPYPLNTETRIGNGLQDVMQLQPVATVATNQNPFVQTNQNAVVQNQQQPWITFDRD